MPKRFTDTDKWDKPWFRKLPLEKKLTFLYLLDKCDRAGFWEIDIEKMVFELGLPRDCQDPFEGLKDIEISGDFLMIRDFIEFQYPKGLRRTNPAHKGIIDALEKMKKRNLFKGLPSPFEEAMEKEEEKDKETAKEITKVFMVDIAKGYDRKLTTTAGSTADGILGLLKKGVTESEIRKTINWLCTLNQQRGKYTFKVLSGGSLLEKWDRVQEAMYGGDKQTQQQKETYATPELIESMNK